MLASYGPEDAREPSGLYGALAECVLLHRILHGQSDRLVLNPSRPAFRWRDAAAVSEPPDRREEAFPNLWDADPHAYLRLLAAARLPEVHAFALRAVEQRHAAILAGATLPELKAMLRSPFESSVRLSLDELRRRFDPQRPDLPLVDLLLDDPRPEVRDLGRDWLRDSAGFWTLDQKWIVLFLTSGDPETSLLAADLAADRLRHSPEMRRELALRLLELLREPEAQPGSHNAYARIARERLLDELDALLDLDALVHLILTGPPPAQVLGGELLARRPEAIDTIGLEGLAQLAGHEIAAVRRATHALLRQSVDRFRSDPGPLLLLVESDWADTRQLAFDLLRTGLGPDVLGTEGLMALLDSNRVDVQDEARDLVLDQFDRFNPAELIARLAEHPHPNMRRFAVDLAVDHLPDGAEVLVRLSWFFRAAVLDLRSERPVKRHVIDLLRDRGRHDHFQAAAAVELLGEFARSGTRDDADRAMLAIVSILLEHPDVPSPVSLARPAGGVA
ncbi:hypothetical protein [Tautonia sociabilis]|uniref:Uncharacterized protein n=1 Tax=Tautonia sociabilis TaxID=2080755 RepID=A0A432MJE6_9BACT|nr:hypothetical protein [Tautonia sociabilis]RUL87512.1 hypothetical protein TsocGM_11785 [Tautonia sociabilis]